MEHAMWCAVCGEWTDHRSGKHSNDYRKIEFVRLAQEANNDLAGDSPLIEDEAIVWAWEEIQKLTNAIEKTIRDNSHLADGENCTLIDLKRASGIE